MAHDGDWFAAAARRGEYVDPDRGRERLGTFYARWIADATLASSTRAKYEGTWRVHVEPKLGKQPLAKLTRADVRSLVDSIESPYQGTEALKLIRRVLNAVVDAEVIGRNVAARVPAPRVERTDVRVLSSSELARVVDELPERWRAFVLLGVYGSLRWSELVAVRRDDLDLDARTVRIDESAPEVRGAFAFGPPKTAGSRRVVDLPRLMVRPLAEHLLAYPPLRSDDPTLTGLVFYAERGGPVRRHVFRPIWRDACIAAQVEPIRLEWLRHTGASIAYAATRDLKATAARLGHTNTRMVDFVYVRLYAETSRSVADAIDAAVDAARSR